MFNRDLKVAQGEKWDLSKVSTEELSKEEVAKNKNRLIEIFNYFNMNGGETLDDVELLKAMDYFGNLDADGDGKISKQELKKGAEYLNEKLQLSGKDEIKAKDLKSFIKNVVKASKDNATVDVDEMFSFDDGDLDIQNVTGSRVEENDGVKNTVLTYEDGRVVTTNPGGTYNVKSTDEEGTVVTEFYSAGNKLLRETTVDVNNDTVVTDFDPNQSERVPVKSVSTTNNGADRHETTFENGREAMCTYTTNGGSTVEIYEYANEEPYITTRIENKGQDTQRTTRYMYNDDGSITAEVKDSNGTTSQVLDDDYQVLSEDSTLNDGTLIERIYADDRSRTEKVTHTDGGTVATEYNSTGKRISQRFTKADGTHGEVEYDGNGNTKVVIQNSETLKQLADKFGCTVEELKELNGGKIRGWAGEEIVVPGEFDADSEALKGRDSRDVVIAKYRAYQAEMQRQKEERDAADKALEERKGYARTFKNTTYDTFEQQARACFAREGNNNPNKYELNLRINELKSLNPNLKDGELKGKQITATFSRDAYASIGQGQLQREEARQVKKAKQEASGALPLAQDMYEAITEHAAGLSEQSFRDALAKVNKDNVVGVLEAYDKLSPNESLTEAIYDEWGNDGGAKRVATTKIINALYDRAISAGVDEEHAKQLKDDAVSELNHARSGNTDVLVGRISNMVAAINTAEHVTREERTSKVTDNSGMRDNTINAGNEALSENRQNLQNQLDRDGWCADLYEGLKWCVGSDNLDENVKADLDKFGGYIKELQDAKAKGGDAAFDAKFKEIFGVNYDPNLARGYSKMQNDYANASALTVQIQGFDETFANSINGQESYETMVQKYGDYIKSLSPEITDGNAAVEKGIALAMEKDGLDFSKATDAQKKEYLRNILSDTQKGLKTELEKYTRGKSLDTMKKDLDRACVSVFGNKGDIVSRVNNYVVSLQKGGAMTNMVVKTVGVIAVTVLTGGTGTAALLTASAATAVTSAAIDLTDRATSNVGLQDGEVLNILKNASIDGATVFAGGKLTQAAMCFKNANAFVQAGGRMLSQTAGDVAIGAIAEYAQTGEITIEGVTFQAIFSAAGNLIALKQIKNASSADGAVATTNNGSTPPADGAVATSGSNPTASADIDVDIPASNGDMRVSPDVPEVRSSRDNLPQNDFLRTTQNGNDPSLVAPENAVGKLNETKLDNAVNYYREEVPTASASQLDELAKRADALSDRSQSRRLSNIVDDEQLRRNITTEDNLGELHNIERRVSNWTDSNRDKEGLLNAIHERQDALRADGSYTVAVRDIDPEVVQRAQAALNKPGRHLYPNELGDIRQYIESLTTPAALDNVVNNLQQRGVKLSSGSRLKHTIDAKYAELNASRPAVQAPEQPAAGSTYTASPEEFSQTASSVRNNQPDVQVPEQPVAATSVPSDVPASSVSTPHLDRVQPHSGRLGGLKKKQITDEVVASINAAKTPQELTALREKISQKISGDDFRADLLARVDSRLDYLKQNQVTIDSKPAVQTPEQPVAASSALADVPASSVSTPRLDRLNPGSGRLGAKAKAEITAEVSNAARAATTIEQLSALKNKIQTKILNPDLQKKIGKIVDDASDNLRMRATGANHTAGSNLDGAGIVDRTYYYDKDFCTRPDPAGTPYLDDLRPGYGGLDSKHADKIAFEVYSTACHATTYEQIVALKNKIREKIFDPASLKTLDKVIDEGAKYANIL